MEAPAVSLAPQVDANGATRAGRLVVDRKLRALASELQATSASEVDASLSRLLHALVHITRASMVRLTLVDIGQQGTRQSVFTESARRCAAEADHGHGLKAEAVEYTIHQARTVRLEWWSPAGATDLQAGDLQSFLCLLHRWLVWLDLSHVPANPPGTIPAGQRSVLLMLLKGYSEKRISAELGQSIHTTHQHVKRLYRLFGVHNRASLMARWLSTDRSLRTAATRAPLSRGVRTCSTLEQIEARSGLSLGIGRKGV